MNSLLAPGATLEKLFTGTAWGEGPAWIAGAGALRWSDIPNNRILEFDAATGLTRVHREDVEFANGRTIDLAGRVVQCTHGRRSVEREVDGEVTTLVDRFGTARLNSPNDVVVASDGSIWFTDPPYGLHPSGREGYPGPQEYDGCFVFRFDEVTGELVPVITDMVHPNGLAFSPDESLLYVSDTGFYGDAAHGPRHLRVYEVDVAAGTTSNGRVFAEVAPEASDGFRIDIEGRIWTSSGDSVQVYSPEGELLEKVPVPEKVANVAFGGADGHDLYITASTSLYRIRTATMQAGRPDGRVN
ncbi:SMP-30/gluconolactonase/LRE family protein [Glaciihabitans sp. dw_435]|uniref:SMP-30/gluconolactonase/LRE family protein n=1 Tax=Glaciihabitans sp. dw_435 TaxID=2720081 RepID=UPI0027DCF941|nr:SMP-30/gluconolactonase/LRE family protein [Glaciihabitans sp. dw_435]